MTKRIVRRLEMSYLERLRLERGLDAQEVCRRAGLDPDSLRRLEVRGAKQPRFDTIRKLAEVYDVRPHKLHAEVSEYRRRFDAAQESEAAA